MIAKRLGIHGIQPPVVKGKGLIPTAQRLVRITCLLGKIAGANVEPRKPREFPDAFFRPDLGLVVLAAGKTGGG
ncbi:MAG: hypothetical protein ACOX64_02250 [Candidatus Merdivicinus sp.]